MKVAILTLLLVLFAAAAPRYAEGNVRPIILTEFPHLMEVGVEWRISDHQ